MVKIFTEGNEKFFLSTILSKMGLENTPEVIFISTGGKEGIAKLDNQFHENTDAGGKNLIIFDADSPKNGGGFEKRKPGLESEIKKLNIKAELFLFPDNQSDGDFETLLEKIANPKHQGLMGCFLNYENCVKQLNQNDGADYRLPIQKSKIFAYVDAFNLQKKQIERLGKKGDWLFEEDEIWDFENENLLPLKKFLRSQLMAESNPS